MINLIFAIDKKFDLMMTRVILQINDPAGLASRADSMGLELSFAEKVNKSTPEEALKLIESVINQKYEALGDKLETICRWYQKSWDEINDQFFSFVALKTKHEWQFSEYFCVVSVIHPGLSNWTSNKIVRIWSENPFDMRKITAHEMIVAHIFSIFHNDPKYQGKLEDMQIWKIAEIAGWCLTGLESDIIKLWPWIPKEKLFYTNHNYPQLVSLQLKLKEVYLKEKDFDKFLDIAINEVKKE